MWSTGPFQFRWLRGYIHSSCYYHHQIGSSNLTHYHIFPWLCAWDVFYIIFWHLLHTHSGKTGILFSLLLCRLWWVQIFELSSLCKLIWGHWTYEIPVRYILSSVWVRLSSFSQLSIIQYMGLCVFSLRISLVMIEKIYTLSYYHHQIRSMNYYPLFRVRSRNNDMRCMSFYSYRVSLYTCLNWIVKDVVTFQMLSCNLYACNL